MGVWLTHLSISQKISRTLFTVIGLESPRLSSLSFTHIFQLGLMKQRERPGATVDWFTNASMVIGFSGLPKKMWVRIRSFKRGMKSRSLLGVGVIGTAS